MGAELALRSVLEVLQDYLDDLVLVGGWVPYLHLRYGRASVADARTSLTYDADLLLPRAVTRGGRRPIAEILSDAGFERRAASGVIWRRDPDRGGGTIEFMQPLRGPAMNRGDSQPVPDQPSLDALNLDHLVVMEEFTGSVLLPAAPAEPPLTVRVPTLGAFAVNKVNTFHLRGGDDSSSKAGKDLLYLRDIMAAGSAATAVLRQDLEAIARAGRSHERSLGRASYHLGNVSRRYHGAAAEILAERDGLDHAAAMADVEGYLTDLAAVFAKVLG